MKKIKSCFLALIGILCLLTSPLINYAQDSPLANERPPEGDSAKALDWVQGSKLFDDWFMDAFLTEYKEIIWQEFDTFIDLARALAGIFALLFFAGRAYGMMTGEQKWEIIPLLRPFGLVLIIVHWSSFVKAVSYPTDLMAGSMWEKQETQQQAVTNMRLIRAEYQKSMIDNLFTISSEAELAAEESKELVKDKEGWFTREMKEGWNELIAPVFQIKHRLQITLQLALTQGLEALALWILRVAVYTIFTIQIVYTGILIMLGPISVATSILPMFRDSFSAWIARFISVNLYLTIALMIMFIGGIFQEFALESEVLRFKEFVDRDGNLLVEGYSKLLWLSSNGILSFGMVIVTFLVTAVCMMTVPSISTWVVSTAGATSAVSTMGRAAAIMTAKFGGTGKLLMGKK
ncbi:plasmid transfer protein [Sphingobacterium siyangense]|uniref:plasmid transfer protein n=1 Tax=Sphingobacterium siyangense TaxID=459529 RepID=UPI00289CE1A0|nr:plasmid transfer protein [Sphingobacterium siyangense]